jgi:hypothetical protein
MKSYIAKTNLSAEFGISQVSVQTWIHEGIRAICVDSEYLVLRAQHYIEADSWTGSRQEDRKCPQDGSGANAENVALHTLSDWPDASQTDGTDVGRSDYVIFTVARDFKGPDPS